LPKNPPPLLPKPLPKLEPVISSIQYIGVQTGQLLQLLLLPPKKAEAEVATVKDAIIAIVVNVFIVIFLLNIKVFLELD
jgi:hypothetical protein